jgi:protein-disulfide isomerase
MTATHGMSLSVPVSALDHVAGSAHAPVVLVEYGDFECPMCQAAEPAVRHLREAFEGRLAFVFRHFPLEDAHPNALLAAEAAEAAGAQGRFWEMHDLLLAPGRHLSRRHLDGYAQQLGLDQARFVAELDDEIWRQRVREHQAGGRASHLRATPGFFINGTFQDVSGGMRSLHDRVEALL